MDALVKLHSAICSFQNKNPRCYKINFHRLLVFISASLNTLKKYEIEGDVEGEELGVEKDTLACTAHCTARSSSVLMRAFCLPSFLINFKIKGENGVN